MSRKSFIMSQGATCRNWNWSWSFTNKTEKIVIFGAWEDATVGNTTVILDETWAYNHAGKRRPGYPESLEHIQLVEKEGYTLKTFPMVNSDERKNGQGRGPSLIKEFRPELTFKTLKRVGSKWYASDDVLGLLLPEEVQRPEKYVEGTARQIFVNAYERSVKARAACIQHYGATCAVCHFDFQARYGEIGAGYIHVHHLIPLSEIKKAYKIDPIKDLRPVCPNCHAIIHVTQPALTLDQLRIHLNNK